ncbi:hypothetical protein FQZ97_877250 [compost metagenome]
MGQPAHRGAPDAHAGQHGVGTAGRARAPAARERPAPPAARQPRFRGGVADAAHGQPQARPGTALPHRNRGAGLAGAPRMRPGGLPGAARRLRGAHHGALRAMAAPGRKRAHPPCGAQCRPVRHRRQPQGHTRHGGPGAPGRALRQPPDRLQHALPGGTDAAARGGFDRRGPGLRHQRIHPYGHRRPYRQRHGGHGYGRRDGRLPLRAGLHPARARTLFLRRPQVGARNARHARPAVHHAQPRLCRLRRPARRLRRPRHRAAANP